LAVGWSQRARADLGAIFAHIAVDNRGAAERWIGRILEHADLVWVVAGRGGHVERNGESEWLVLF
jgi:plasmid stabilization system protein ParE